MADEGGSAIKARAKDNPEHEAAAAKLWAVYVSEAEKYDRGLVESWKSDMEGMLIFAGLFSASLTAFLIESYKTLNTDSGETTALLLAQISQQLAASANGTAFHIPPPVPFTPPTSSLICNILWFISLGLSLTCALIATLLEQWARDFLHRADMRSAPVVRARVFSFLYYGLKRFKMHTVVEIIPLLLHASLFLFFVGLVVFLLPVNIVLTVVVGIILATVTIVYGLLTLLPLAHLDCPYRTPLSRGFWSLHRSVQSAFSGWYYLPAKPVSPLEDETIVESVFRKATEPSPQRSSRDTQALVWAVKSLADDYELEPFLEAIPDALWRPGDSTSPELLRRYVLDDQMRRLMDDPNVQLLRRLGAFYNSCSSGLLSQEVRVRREICVYKAVWALGCLSPAGKPVNSPLGSQWGGYLQVAPEVSQYATSAVAIQAWANTRGAQPLLDETLRCLTGCKIELNTDNSKLPNMSQLPECMAKLAEYSIRLPMHLKPYDCRADGLLWEIENSIEYIRALPFTIFVGYLSRAGESNIIPYRFATTRSLIQPKTETPSSVHLHSAVASALNTMMQVHRELFQTEDDVRGQGHWLDEVFRTILLYWEPEGSQALPWAVLDYLNCRKSDGAVDSLISTLSKSAWKSVPRSIGAEPNFMFPTFGDHAPVDYLTSSLTAVWRLLSQANGASSTAPDSLCFDELMDSVSRINVPSLAPSVKAIAKCRFFGNLFYAACNMHQPDLISSFNDSHFPAQTSVSLPADGELQSLILSVHSRCVEAGLDTFSEFIECCVSGDLPYKAEETAVSVAWPVQASIHPVHQLRFSCAVQHLVNAAVDSAERDALSRKILNLPIFSVYVPKDNGESDPWGSNHAWLDNLKARTTLKETLSAYAARLSSTEKEHKICSRVQAIVANLDIMHPQ
ncbi:hypothetical protein DFH06DRAFT_1473216 [Mycena polygramma]|nr:hypothetical protein DFH06DRAFT_1473216 [Mycena polygramma]